jgi:hypothetical protein
MSPVTGPEEAQKLSFWELAYLVIFPCPAWSNTETQVIYHPGWLLRFWKHGSLRWLPSPFSREVGVQVAQLCGKCWGPEGHNSKGVPHAEVGGRGCAKQTQALLLEGEGMTVRQAKYTGPEVTCGDSDRPPWLQPLQCR